MNLNANVRAEANDLKNSVEMKEFLTAVAYLKRKSKILFSHLWEKIRNKVSLTAKRVATKFPVAMMLMSAPAIVLCTVIAVNMASANEPTATNNLAVVQNVKSMVTTDYDVQTYTLGTLTKRSATYSQSRAVSMPTVKYQALMTDDLVVLELHQIGGDEPVAEVDEPIDEEPIEETEEEAGDFDSEYIPVITLDYEWETFEMPYEHQKFIYDTCEKYEGVEFRDIMCIIARESRFDPTVQNGSHYGYMQVCDDAIEEVEKRLDITIDDPFDPYQNITVGIDTFAYQYSRTPTKYAAHWAYAQGYTGYLNDIEAGKTHNKHVDKAYKYYDMLSDTERNPRATEK